MKKLRQILCIAGALLLAGLYLLTLILALMGSSSSGNMLMAAIFATFAVPIFLYVFFMITKLLAGRKDNDRDE